MLKQRSMINIVPAPRCQQSVDFDEIGESCFDTESADHGVNSSDVRQIRPMLARTRPVFIELGRVRGNFGRRARSRSPNRSLCVRGPTEIRRETSQTLRCQIWAVSRLVPAGPTQSQATKCRQNSDKSPSVGFRAQRSKVRGSRFKFRPQGSG